MSYVRLRLELTLEEQAAWLAIEDNVQDQLCMLGRRRLRLELWEARLERTGSEPADEDMVCAYCHGAGSLPGGVPCKDCERTGISMPPAKEIS